MVDFQLVTDHNGLSPRENVLGGVCPKPRGGIGFRAAGNPPVPVSGRIHGESGRCCHGLWICLCRRRVIQVRPHSSLRNAACSVFNLSQG